MKKYLFVILITISFWSKGFSQNKMDSLIIAYAEFLCEFSIGCVNEIERDINVVHITTYDSLFNLKDYYKRPEYRKLIIRVESRMTKYWDYFQDFKGAEIKTIPFCEKVIVYSYGLNRFYKISGFNTTDINSYLFDHNYNKKLKMGYIKFVLEEFFPEWTKKKRRKFKRLIWKNRKMMDFINQENCYERRASHPFVY